MGLLALTFVASYKIHQNSLGPLSHGKPLAYWLNVLDTQIHTNLDEKRRARTAIKDAGVQAQPYLLRQLSRKDSKLISQLEAFLNRKLGMEVHLPKAEDRRRKAIRGYYVLAEVIQPNARLDTDGEFRRSWEDLMEFRKRYKSEWPQVKEFIHRASALPPQ